MRDVDTPYRDSDRLAQIEGRVEDLEQQIGSKQSRTIQLPRDYTRLKERLGNPVFLYECFVLLITAAMLVVETPVRGVAFVALILQAVLAGAMAVGRAI